MQELINEFHIGNYFENEIRKFENKFHRNRPTQAAKETKALQCKIIQINLKVLQIIRATFRISSEIQKITEYKVKRGQRHTHEAPK